MDPKQLHELLQSVRNNTIGIDEAIERLRLLPFENLGYARIDHHRALRNGIGEVIYCAGKTDEQITGIVQSMSCRSSNILATRIGGNSVRKIQALGIPVQYHAIAHIAVIRPQPLDAIGHIAVISAGTSDMPVAEEAAITAETLGNRVTRLYDAGVAGIHRLLLARTEWIDAHAIVVVAGMEGALASVVGGMAACPVIAVPTSVGYGASFGGLAALLAMLNSCAVGVSVVNIDNGFGAACQASLINHLAAENPNRDASADAERHSAESSISPETERKGS